MIKVVGISKSFNNKKNKKKVVDDLTFSLDKGDILGFIGKNGAGKSTTIKMLCGILTPDDGEIYVDGIVPYKSRKKNGMNIGVVFGQKTQLWWDLPLRDSFTILKRIYKVSKDDFVNRMSFFEEIFGINCLLDKQVRTLSLGEKMKAEICAALLHNPKILYLDEPTIGLDFFSKRKMRNAILQINQKYKTTIILTTHDLEDIDALCNKIIVVDKGKKIYEGSYDDLLLQFQNDKLITVKFNDAKALEDFTRNNKVNISDGLMCSFNAKNIAKTKELMATLLQDKSVVDISITTEPLENIIESIYSRNRG